MRTILRDKSVSHLLIVFLFLALFAYTGVIAWSVSGLKNKVDSLADKGTSSKVAYAQLSSDTTQRATSSRPAKMRMGSIDAIRGVEFDPKVSPTDVKIIHDGVYFLMAAPQVGRLDADTRKPACANFFFSINNKPLANSNVTRCFPEDTTSEKDVIMTQAIVPLQAGDEVSAMIATSSIEEGIGIEAFLPDDQPVVPSIIFSMFRLGDE